MINYGPVIICNRELFLSITQSLETTVVGSMNSKMGCLDS